MKGVRHLAYPIPNVPGCQHSLRHLTLTSLSMADNYLDPDLLPLTRVVGGSISLKNLIAELDEMYPDNYPDHEMTAWESGRMAGCIEIIRYLKSKV